MVYRQTGNRSSIPPITASGGERRVLSPGGRTRQGQSQTGAHREQARKTIEEKYALNKLLPLHISLIKDLADRKLPPPTAMKLRERHKDKELELI